MSDASPVLDSPDFTMPSGWFARRSPANRRRQRAEKDRLLAIRSVTLRADVIGVPVPADVTVWPTETSLNWLGEHRNDPPVV